MIENTSAHDKAEVESASTEPEVEAYSAELNTEKKSAESDPFFGTGFFSFHHQPEDVDDETFMGE